MDNVYFARRIRGSSHLSINYDLMIDFIESKKFKVINKEALKPTTLSDRDIFSRDVNLLAESDILIAEVSNSSLGVGFEIGWSLKIVDLPVLCLASMYSTTVSAMIIGCPYLSFRWYDTETEALELIRTFLMELK